MGTDQAHDLLEIKRALTVLYQPGDIVELRALDVSGKTVAGYFDDPVKLVESAIKLSGQASGVYVVLNTITPALLARSANRVSVGPKNLTQDSDIIRRRYLHIDIDAKRPAGISALDEAQTAYLWDKSEPRYGVEFIADELYGYLEVPITLFHTEMSNEELAPLVVLAPGRSIDDVAHWYTASAKSGAISTLGTETE